jgi:hypothetical protein
MYADLFNYTTLDLTPPYSPERYEEAIRAALQRRPGVIIIDSVSHMHDGPGGMLEYHETEIDRITKGSTNFSERQKATWSAWIKPKQAETKMIYAMIDSPVHFVLCFRAKEKLKIIPGKNPVPLGWQPIASDRIAFETAFTLLLPPHCNGVPDLSAGASEMQIDEQLGQKLLAWAAGAGTPAQGEAVETVTVAAEAVSPVLADDEQQASIVETARRLNVPTAKAREILSSVVEGAKAPKDIPADKVPDVLAALAASALEFA